MWTSLLAAIAAIPKLIEKIEQLLAFFKKADEEKWFSNTHEIFQQLKKAETDEERLKAAKGIQDAIRNL